MAWRNTTQKVKKDVVVSYIRAIGPASFLSSVLFYCGFQAFNTAANFWLTSWTEDPILTNQSLTDTSLHAQKNAFYLGIYGFYGLVQFLLALGHSYLYWVSVVRGGQRLHDNMIGRVFRAPMAFFDTTPVGRIVNRASRDVETIDNNLPLVFKMFLATSCIVLSTVITISIATPIFIAVLLPLSVFYYCLQMFYIPTSRQLKRLESVTRSPIFVHFSETVSGAATIRAYRVLETFMGESRHLVNRNLAYYFTGTNVAMRWLSVYSELVSSLVVFAAAVFALVSGTDGSTAGLSVSYALQISNTLSWMVRQVSDMETNIVSVERVNEYAQVDSEAEWVNPFNRPPPQWPHTGDVEFKDYQTRYRAGLDLVLKGVTCRINGGEKVGIVGRTGAGKSSLTVALFRLIEPAGGAIIIDGIDIAHIGLHDLRGKLTILPQDPVLFSGSLRMNLDPFDEYSDAQVWTALERSHLKEFVAAAPGQLLYECGEEGQNLSVGQRQLVCLARTLLRHTKILVLDEATAAVDLETDELVQQTIRQEFKDCTILTIAHRLNTILDYDRIIVMDAGVIKEFDTPEALLNNKTSIFYGMAKDAGLV